MGGACKKNNWTELLQIHAYKYKYRVKTTSYTSLIDLFADSHKVFLFVAANLQCPIKLSEGVC